MAQRLALYAALLLGAPACSDPVAAEIAAYHQAMDPLMTQNTQLANQFLVLAKAVHKDKQDMDQIVARVERDVIPAADGLKDSITAVEPGLEELRDIHQQAITAWGLQSSAYHEMATAYKGNDPKAFAAAQQKLGQAKVTIESYVKEVNRLLEPYGYHMDEFPQVQ